MAVDTHAVSFPLRERRHANSYEFMRVLVGRIESRERPERFHRRNTIWWVGSNFLDSQCGGQTGRTPLFPMRLQTFISTAESALAGIAAAPAIPAASAPRTGIGVSRIFAFVRTMRCATVRAYRAVCA